MTEQDPDLVAMVFYCAGARHKNTVGVDFLREGKGWPTRCHCGELFEGKGEPVRSGT